MAALRVSAGFGQPGSRAPKARYSGQVEDLPAAIRARREWENEKKIMEDGNSRPYRASNHYESAERRCDAGEQISKGALVSGNKLRVCYNLKVDRVLFRRLL